MVIWLSAVHIKINCGYFSRVLYPATVVQPGGALNQVQACTELDSNLVKLSTSSSYLRPEIFTPSSNKIAFTLFSPQGFPPVVEEQVDFFFFFFSISLLTLCHS